jgi:hypothetical protein
MSQMTKGGYSLLRQEPQSLAPSAQVSLPIVTILC